MKSRTNEIDHIIGCYTSKLQVMDVCVNEPFKDYDWQEHEKFMVANVDKMKVSREDVVFWMEGG